MPRSPHASRLAALGFASLLLLGACAGEPPPPAPKPAASRPAPPNALTTSQLMAAAALRAAAEAMPKWENSLGMKFVPCPGSAVRVCIWDTRVRDFQAFVTATGHQAEGGMYALSGQQFPTDWLHPGFPQTPDCPVVGVSWHDAEAFCRWLTNKERAEGRIGPGARYRLPTDTEWSAAAGLVGEPGATPADKDKRVTGVFPWGMAWPPPAQSGNFAGESFHGTQTEHDYIAGYDDGYTYTSPVGRFAPNLNGLYDMAGNVWQWCEDEYSPGDGQRVLRGSSYSSFNPAYMIISYRSMRDPNVRSAAVGFRCVLDPAPGPDSPGL